MKPLQWRLLVRHSIKSPIRPVALHKQPKHMQSPHSPNENKTIYPKTSPFPLQDSTFVFYFKTAACWNQMHSVFEIEDQSLPTIK